MSQETPEVKPTVTESAPVKEAPAPVSVPANVIEGVRKEEKDKLYTQISSLEARLAEANKTAAERESLTKALQEKESELAALKASIKPEGGINIEEVIKQTAQNVTQTVASQKEKELVELRQRLDSVESERKREQLEAHRQRLLNESQGETIPAMIIGNTIEELNANAVRAKEAYDKALESAGVKKGASNATSNLPPTVSPRADNGGSGNPPAQGTSSVKNMSMADYKANRSKFLAELKQRHG